MKPAALVVDENDIECLLDLIEIEMMSAYHRHDLDHLSDLYNRISLVYERANCN